MYKVPKEVKRYYERELRQYWNNKQLLENLKNEKANTRRIILLERRIKNIETVIAQLTEFEKLVFTYIYKDNMDWKYCFTIKGINKNTYYNVLNKVIYMLAEEEGDI